MVEKSDVISKAAFFQIRVEIYYYYSHHLSVINHLTGLKLFIILLFFFSFFLRI